MAEEELRHKKLRIRALEKGSLELEALFYGPIGNQTLDDFLNEVNGKIPFLEGLYMKTSPIREVFNMDPKVKNEELDLKETLLRLKEAGLAQNEEHLNEREIDLQAREEDFEKRNRDFLNMKNTLMEALRGRLQI